MSDDKKQKKENTKSSENKKTKFGMSKETLEKLLETKIHKEKLPPKEEFESIISDEEIAFLNKKERPPRNQERTIIQNNPMRILERDLTEETNSGNEVKGNSRNGEYISGNAQKSDGEKKYQSYEANISPQAFHKVEEISKGWSKPFVETPKFKEVHSETEQKNQKYENYFTPRNFSEKELKERKIGRDFQEFEFQEKKMHYYEGDH